MKNKDNTDRLFEAYIATPGQYDWYRKAFAALGKNGKMSWYWNTWAMLGTFWYFLYRKQMKMALITLFVLMLLGLLLPFPLFVAAYLIIMLLCGGYGTWFVYTQYRERRKEVEALVKDREKRIAMMQRFGGVNRWAIPVGAFAFASLILILVGLFRIVAANH